MTLMDDSLWRLGNLYQIRPEEGGAVQPYVMRPEQLEFAKGRHGRDIIIKTRKLGFSTHEELEMLDECLTRPNVLCAVVDLTQAKAEDKLDIARVAYVAGPHHPDPAIAAIWRGIHRRVKIVKDNGRELAFSNGSRIEAGVTFRGGTPQRLHLSEFGPVAAENLRRAAEIVSGAIAAVPATGKILIETTYKGGRYGHCYRLCKLAMDRVGQPLAPLDWDFWFFAWYEHPNYVLPARRVLNAETIAYRDKLRTDYGIELAPERWAWWEATKAVQGDAMAQEFPSTAEEVFTAKVAGQIYPVMARLRAEGRLSKPLAVENGPPLFTCWDIGISDRMAGWLVQFVGRDVLIHRWESFDGQGAQAVADTIRRWEQQTGRPIHQHFLPHDADNRGAGSGLTFRQHLEACGIVPRSIVVVPRTVNIWVGISAVRAMLQRAWFDVSCDRETKLPDGTPLPSGVGCLEGYRTKKPGPSGEQQDMPLHDLTSHSADALRTLAEAAGHNLLHMGGEALHRPGFTVLRSAGLEPRHAGERSAPMQILRGPR